MIKNAFFSSLLREASKKIKKENFIAVISNGSFSGNSKAVFLIISSLLKTKHSKWKICWLTPSDREKHMLSNLGFYSLSYDNDRNKAIEFSILAKYTIHDNHNFQDIDNWFWQSCFWGARSIQTWHGIPAKKVGYEYILSVENNNFSASGMISDCFRYNYCITESPITCKLYHKLFPSSVLLPFGSPRNDFLVRQDIDDLLFIDNTNIKQHLIQIKSSKRIVMIAPTYRECNQNNKKYYLLSKLIKILIQKGIYIILKLHEKHLNTHPNDLDFFKMIDYDKEKLLIVHPQNDIYPYLKMADILVTDYSSVATDFLITEKPIVYFRPDEDEYWQFREKPTVRLYNEKDIGPIFNLPDECADYIANQNLTAPEPARILASKLHSNYKTGTATEALLEFILSEANRSD